jgi:hypothetical protein
VGALAAIGAVLVFTTSDALVLRTALVGSILVSVGLLVLLRQRETGHARAMKDESTARRREQSLFQGELDTLRASLAALTAQIAQLQVDAQGLRAEIGTLREEKAEADEMVRRLRAARAYRPAPRHLALMPAAFEAAAEALSALSGPSGEEDDSLGGLTRYLSRGLADTVTAEPQSGEQVIDLTPHDDTLPISLAAVRGA